jgi:hypothetical protein
MSVEADEFRGKATRLRYRGSRDGFGAAAFHRICDGRPNTLTIIQTTDGNVFGGHTTVPWDSLMGWRSDEQCRSFLFTIKNPHGIPPRTFRIRPERKDHAIWCGKVRGPSFGGKSDLYVCDRCNQFNSSKTSGFGDTYENDTGVEGSVLFTGSDCFRVKEIEVFEIGEVEPPAHA